MTDEEQSSVRERDEADIRAIEASYDRAWNSADLAGLMSVLEPDVVIISPMGRESVGADSTRRLLEDFLLGPGLGSTHTSRLKRVSFVSDDVALLDGEATIEGPNLPEPLVHDFTDIFVRREDQWKIAHIRAYVFLDVGAP
jgi:uncharacterized protein (TIGR02246 family)